jgi:two-component system response regulator HydG
MPDAGVLLISPDSSLSSMVEGLVSRIPSLKFERAADQDVASGPIDGRRYGLVLYHLDQHSHVAGLTRLIATLVATGRTIPVLVLSDEYHAEQALTLLRLGVADYLGRPLDLGRLAYLMDILTLEARYGRRRDVAAQGSPQDVITLEGDSPFLFLPDGRMARTIDQIKRIAPLDTTILLGGETGTGKTHLAGIIHRLSSRRDKPFLTLNCGALATNLIESEMFGHVKGSFTGADAERTGKFAAVGRGTLFLDEIDSLSPALQAKLLRVVEERAFEPVGSNKTLKLQARLIAASNRPIEEEVSAGRFRTDLFYRLNVVAFELPPLRERKAVIPALAESLLTQAAQRNGRPPAGICPLAMQALMAHSWPGNIRELRNVLERAVALAAGPMITLDDLPERFHHPLPVPAAAPDPSPTRSTLAQTRDDVERVQITAALQRNGNNRLRAAAELGISRMTLYKKLHKLGLFATP